MLLHEAAKDRRTAGAKKLDVDSGLGLEQLGKFLRGFYRRRRIPYDLAFFLGGGSVYGVGGIGRRNLDDRQGDECGFEPVSGHYCFPPHRSFNGVSPSAQKR